MRGARLFLIGFLVLFLELACIRWFAAHVIFLQFFTNVVLFAAFLGLSCGCLAARGRVNWLARTPFLMCGTFLAAILMLWGFHAWAELGIDVHQRTPQEVFFGTEGMNSDMARFLVPIELIAGVFFVLIALLFVGLGQALGQAFDAFPDRVRAYSLNIAGSLAGIAAFAAVSFAQLPPVAWFLVACGGIGFVLFERGELTRVRAAALVLALAAVATPAWLSDRGVEYRWSPYYAIRYRASDRTIAVNTINHQIIQPFDGGAGAMYSLIHLLQRQSGGPPFKDVLVIGAGSGNDVAHALRFGAARVDAVEIDPVIQSIGVAEHPDHPYQDARTVRWLDDGRHYLRTTERKYDLVVYAYVDSLILHSSYANIRLESFLFTDEAFADVRRVLKPDGVFVVYNYLRQGWIARRAGAMAEKAFGARPIAILLPYAERVASDEPVDFVMFIAGGTRGIADAFRRRGAFWLNADPRRNLDGDGFASRPSAIDGRSAPDWMRIEPAAFTAESGAAATTSDDWPFLYVRGRMIPALTLRSMAVFGVLSLAMLYMFVPARRARLDGRMLFLGAGFMLIETKAVVHLALLFGSTWIVNSAVFFSVLMLILLANLYVLKARAIRPALHYAGLVALLALGAVVPLDLFLGGGVFTRYVVPCALALGPMFFAGVIFAQAFRDAADPDCAFGSNVAGSVVGGLTESCATLLGFRSLLLVAIVFYAASAWAPSLSIGRPE